MSQHDNAQTEQKKFDTEYQHDALCPYCGRKARDAWEMDDGTYDCDCGNEYELIRNIEISYSTFKIKEKENETA